MTAGATAGVDELSGALQRFVGLEAGRPYTARDPVNQPMIRHWCDAMGDANPIYTDPVAAQASGHGSVVAPPTMLQAWNMPSLAGERDGQGAQAQLMTLLDQAGFSSVVATDCEQEYRRYLVPGDVLTESGVVEEISPLKRTALGDGYFVTTLRTYRDQAGDTVATMRFRVLKFRPRSGGSREADRPRPPVNRDTAFFWEGTAAGELRIQRCAGCARLRHPPSPACGACGALEWDYVVSSGRGRVYSFVVHHHPAVPPFTAPFVVALVELDEGTRLIGNLLVEEPAEAAVGLAVEVCFVPAGDGLALPQWRPRR